MFFISSFCTDFRDFLDGYAFVDASYVHGQDGYDLHLRDSGRRIGPGEDGCYVVASATPRGYEIGTDAAGLGRLFIYRNGSEWAICSSFSGLVRKLRERNLPLTLRPERLRPFEVPNAFSLQLSTFQTAFDEIRLVATQRIVRIDHDGPKIVPLAKEHEGSYSDTLAQFVNTWRARVRTLMSDPRISISADLSGGNDSRLVLAFLLESGLFSTKDSRFSVFSNPKMPDDFNAASVIAKSYDISLNGPSRPPSQHRSAHMALTHWEDHSLGVYMPAYVDQPFRGPFEIHAHGAGGGNVRPVFGGETPSARAKNYSGKIPAEALRLWRNDLLSTEQQLTRTAPSVHPMIQHYIEFRSRFHFGHIPRARPLLTPLTSKYVAPVADQLSDNRNQLYFDVIESLVPGLSRYSYDVPNKAPTDENFSRLTTAKLLELPQGKVYGQPRSTRSSQQGGPSATTMWVERVATALEQRHVREFLGAQKLALAEEGLAQISQPGANFASHSAEAVLASYCLTVSFVLQHSH